jgi:nicotinamidase-related amidase
MADQSSPKPLTEDGGRVALLVIDVQQGLFRRSTRIYRGEELLTTIHGLVERAHTAGAPVVYIQHSSEKVLPFGSDEWRLHPDLHPTEADRLVHKRHGNAFEETELDAVLKSEGVGTVVVTGLVTHGCVKNSCIGAHELDYRVVLVSDGHSSYSKDAARLIEEWNRTLSAGTAEVKPAREVEFL